MMKSDSVLIASGVATDLSRFKDKTVIEWPVGKIINEAKEAVNVAINARQKRQLAKSQKHNILLICSLIKDRIV